MYQRSTITIAASCLLLAGGNSALAFTTAPATSIPTRSSSSTVMNMSNNSRRNFLTNLAPLAGAAAFTVMSNPALALDFDAFEKSEIASDTAKCDPKKDPKCIPKLSKDEALCQYGGGGLARGEACMRVRKAGGTLPEIKKEKSLGGAYAM